jgi:hypothetical protein
LRIHLYLNSYGLDSYRKGEQATGRLAPIPNNQHEIHVDVHEDEVVEIYPSGFALIRGKGK